MTSTLHQTSVLSAFENEELYEKPIPCSLVFNDHRAHKSKSCPNVATYDAIVTCEHNHERTQHYCARCLKGALNGMVDCRVCRTENFAEPNKCPVTVLASYPRKYEK